jgi:hypothetical protein
MFRLSARGTSKLTPSPNKHIALYLHGGWRCASTYVWSRFRQIPHTLCFYEPFGEHLARCTRRRIRRDTVEGWNSRHPQLARPYRAEYLPLLGRLFRGVPGYREPFAYARYFPGSDGVGAETGYLSRLLRLALANGRLPVFGFSRSLARAALLKRELGGYHVLVRRNPVQQWLSCRSYRGQVPLGYFELCHFLILALAPPESPAGRFAAALHLPRPAPGLERQFRQLHAAVHPWSDELSYRAFTAVSLLSHAAAEPAADLLLDVDRLGRSQQYREALRARLLADVGLEVGFEDCRVPSHNPARLPLEYARIEHEVKSALLSFGARLAPELAPARAVGA